MRFLSQNALDQCGISPGQHLIVTVSGGQDSMVLAFALVANNFQTTWAHCNFGLRGEESQRDEDFVRSQAKELGVALHVRQFTSKDFSETGTSNTQAAARKLRYDWFEELRVETEADAICVAHHADDQVETLFMNLVRGTGMDGLTGMAWRHGMIARPMLDKEQNALAQYAIENRIEHVEDSSNSSTKYKRNRFRHDVLPILKLSNPNLVNTVLREQEYFRDQAAIEREYIDKMLPEICEVQGIATVIDLSKLENATATNLLIWHIIKSFGFTSGQADEVAKLAHAQSGKTVSSLTHKITRDRDNLMLTPQSSDIPQEASFETVEELSQSPWFEVKSVSGRPSIESDKNLGLFDSKSIVFPLILRQWEPGDHFIPLGMKQQQKISDFLTQAKIDSSVKSRVLVLLSAGRIIWVVGERISNEVKINPETTDYLSVRLKSKV